MCLNGAPAIVRSCAQHRARICNTNLLGYLDKEMERHVDVIGISTDDVSLIRLIGVIPFETNDRG